MTGLKGEENPKTSLIFTIDFQLTKGRIYFTTKVVLRFYRKSSLHLSEFYLLKGEVSPYRQCGVMYSIGG